MDKLEAEENKKKKGEVLEPGMREFLEKYEEVSRTEKNRDRNEYRTYQICKDASNLTKSQKDIMCWTIHSGKTVRQRKSPETIYRSSGNTHSKII